MLRAVQPGRRPDHRSTPRTFAAATVLCLFLLALLAVVQVAHIHPLEPDGDHCPLCIVMHSVAPVAMAAAVIILVEVGTPAPTVEPRAAVRSWLPTLFIRPPPCAS